MAQAKRLTEKGVQNLRPGNTRVEHPDTVVPGLRLVVQPSGRKSWAIRGRLHGKTLKYTFATYPAVLLGSIDQDGTARHTAQQAANAIERGQDPREIRQREKDNRLASAVERWLEHDQKGKRRIGDTRNMLKADILPTLGAGRPIAEISQADCRRLVRKVGKRSPSQGRRVRVATHRLFEWLIEEGELTANPMAGVKAPKVPERDRVLDDEELTAVWSAAEQIGWPFGTITQLLILTGCRSGEITGLHWPEWEGGSINLPPSRVKTGEARIVPLSSPAQAILKQAPMTDEELAFTTTGRTPVSGWSRAKRRLDKISGVEDWIIHDLRRTVATGLQRLGIRLEVTEAVLGHTSGARGGIVGVYQRYEYDDEKRAALNAWARHVFGDDRKVVAITEARA